MPKRTLLPMWDDGKTLHSFDKYKEIRMQVEVSTKRVWVGLRKDMTNLSDINKECVKDWIFEDVAVGYEQVKRFNDSVI